MSDEQSATISLRSLLVAGGFGPLDEHQDTQFAAYLDLLIRWNARMNLTAVRRRDDILRTHFVECIACARALPAEIRTLLDFGSGAGFPGIPISICRPEIAVTLAESQTKKASFLSEAVRLLGLKAKVVPSRAESIATRFDCVAMRAVDRMSVAIQVGCQLLSPGGWLAVMTTKSALDEVRRAAGPDFLWDDALLALPGSDQRVLALARSAAHKP